MSVSREEAIRLALGSALNLESLRTEYFRLAMQHHPDKGGDTETMQFINDLYSELFDRMRDRYEANTSEERRYENYSYEQDELFRDIISKLIRLSGLHIEICGSWLWIGGNTKENKETLKELKCYWSRDKQLWYWKPYESRYPKNRSGLSMVEIRSLYGSHVVSRDYEDAVSVGGA